MDAYVNSNIVDGKKADAALSGNGEVNASLIVVPVAAADADGDVYRLLKSVPGDARIKSITLEHGAITGGTDWDVGLYSTDLGPVKSKDALADGLTLASAGSKDGLSGVALTDRAKRIYELAGDSKSEGGYDLCLTANTVGTVAGTIVATIELLLS